MVAPWGKVLVTGGAGFIGCALSHRLAAESERWVCLDNLHPQVHPRAERPAGLAPEAELVVGDVTDARAWESLLADLRPDTVVHLAAETGTGQSLTESTRHGQVNVVGTTTMLDAFVAAGHRPRHVVLTSSRAVYGEGTWRRLEDDSLFQPALRPHDQLASGAWDFEGAVAVPNAVATTTPAPSSVYGATKLAQEHILSAWTSSMGSALSVLRLQNVYGPGQSLSNPYTGIVSLFSRLARDGRSIPLYEDGQVTRDFVYIDDVASAIDTAVRRSLDVPRITVDVGTGVHTTIADLAGEIARHHGAPEPHVTGQFRDGDVRHAMCDVTATASVLGWQPRWSLADGVAALQSWIDGELDGSATA